MCDCDCCNTVDCEEEEDILSPLIGTLPPPPAFVAPSAEVVQSEVFKALDRYPTSRIHLPALVAIVCQGMNCTAQNYSQLSTLIRDTVRTMPGISIIKGAHGGIMRATSVQTVQAVTVHADNYTCGCGNSKLCTETDKSCWRCGSPVIKR